MRFSCKAVQRTLDKDGHHCKNKIVLRYCCCDRKEMGMTGIYLMYLQVVFYSVLDRIFSYAYLG